VNKTGYGCPPNNWPDFANGKAYNVWFIPKDMNTWLDLMENTYGIERSWIIPYTYRDSPCIPPQPCDDFGNVYFYHIDGNANIPDPAADITKNLASYSGLVDWLSETSALDSSLMFQGTSADVVDGAAMSVYSVYAAVNTMKTVEDIGKKEEDAEALQIILWFVTAILMLLPGIGQELAAITDSAIFARMGALLSDAGNIGLSILDIVKDPGSAPLVIGGFLIGGLASRDSGAFTSAAGKRRQLPDSVITALGKDVSDGLGKISGKYKLCKL
jgi:hypothetical protein